MSEAELPHITAGEIQQMKKESKTAVWLMAVITILSFVPYALEKITPEQATMGSFGITIVGLFGAAYSDLKAERIKRQGVGAPTGTPTDSTTPRGVIRWYHWVFIIVTPYIAFPWGIVNLIRGRLRSGLLLLIGSIVSYGIFMGLLFFFMSLSKKS